MDPVKQLVWQVAKYTAIVNGAAMILAAVLFKNPMPVVLSIAFGAVFSIWSFYELSVTLTKTAQMAAGRAQFFASAKYFLRFFLTALVVGVSIVTPHLNVLGTAFGIVSIKFVVLTMNFFNKKVKPLKA